MEKGNMQRSQVLMCLQKREIFVYYVVHLKL